MRLAVGNHVYYLEYAPRFPKLRVSSKSCWEPGSFWTVKVTKLEDLGELTDATCAGEMDEQVHGAVAVVRDYLTALARDPATTLAANASSRWKASQSFMEYESIAHKLDLTLYNLGRFLCLEISQRETPDRVRIETSDCLIQLQHKPAFLTFTVVKDAAKAPWVIDQVSVK